MGVEIKKDATKDILAALKRLTKREVLVGIPQASAERKLAPGEKEPASNALIGYVHEFGSPLKNIPARPFLVPGVTSVFDEISARMSRVAAAILEAAPGQASTLAETQLTAAGLTAQAAVQIKITEGPFQPLAPRTLAARRAKGRTGDKPLIDTGQLRQAITFVVRDKGK